MRFHLLLLLLLINISDIIAFRGPISARSLESPSFPPSRPPPSGHQGEELDVVTHTVNNSLRLCIL